MFKVKLVAPREAKEMGFLAEVEEATERPLYRSWQKTYQRSPRSYHLWEQAAVLPGLWLEKEHPESPTQFHG